MLFGILLIWIMLRVDWKNAEDKESEGLRLIARIVTTFFAIRLWGGSFIVAVLVAVAWGYVGGVIFSVIGDDRVSAAVTSSAPAKKIVQRREYLVNGRGEVTNKVFNASEYSGYSVIESNSEGRILADPSGKIICTKYVTK